MRYETHSTCSANQAIQFGNSIRSFHNLPGGKPPKGSGFLKLRGYLKNFSKSRPPSGWNLPSPFTRKFETLKHRSRFSKKLKFPFLKKDESVLLGIEPENEVWVGEVKFDNTKLSAISEMRPLRKSHLRNFQREEGSMTTDCKSKTFEFNTLHRFES